MVTESKQGTTNVGGVCLFPYSNAHRARIYDHESKGNQRFRHQRHHPPSEGTRGGEQGDSLHAQGDPDAAGEGTRGGTRGQGQDGDQTRPCHRPQGLRTHREDPRQRRPARRLSRSRLACPNPTSSLLAGEGADCDTHAHNPSLAGYASTQTGGVSWTSSHATVKSSNSPSQASSLTSESLPPTA